MEIAVKSVGVLRAEIRVDAADCQIHLGHPPSSGIGFLPVDRDIAEPPAVRSDELFALDEHAA